MKFFFSRPSSSSSSGAAKKRRFWGLCQKKPSVVERRDIRDDDAKDEPNNNAGEEDPTTDDEGIEENPDEYFSPKTKTTPMSPERKTTKMNPTKAQVEAAARAIFGSNRAAEDWAVKFLGGLAGMATELGVAHDGSWLELDVTADGEIATRSRLGMQWRVAKLKLTWRDPRVEIEGLRLVPIQGADIAFQGLRDQWISEGFLSGESCEMVAPAAKFLESAWRWWKQYNDRISHTKYWRVCDSLLGKQVLRSTTPTNDLALVVVGCACGCAWNITAAVFVDPQQQPTSPVAASTGDSTSSLRRTALAAGRDRRQASSPHSQNSPIFAMSSRSITDGAASPGSTSLESSSSEPYLPDDQDIQLYLEYSPVVETLDDPSGGVIVDPPPVHRFKAGLSESIMRDSFASSLTVRVCRKFATSAFNFALAFYDLADIGLPRADAMLVTKLFQASDVVGGASAADRLKGALWWQRDDPTYKMTGPNGRVLWHPHTPTDVASDDDDDDAVPAGYTSSEPSVVDDDDVVQISEAFSETDPSSHSSGNANPILPADFEPAIVSGKTSRQKRVVTWTTAPPDCVLPNCL